MPNFKFVVVGALLISAAAGAVAMKPAPRAAQTQGIRLEQVIPATFGEWRIDPNIVPVQPNPDTQATLDRIYDQVLNRTYVNGKGERIMLSIAYGGTQNNDLKAHRQEVCYTAQGFKITELFQDTLALGEKTIPITRMVAVQGGRIEPVTYWFTMGDRVVLGRFERLMIQLKHGLSRQIPDGMLVRVSNLSTDARAAYSAHVDFVHELMASMRKEDVPRLVGAPGS